MIRACVLALVLALVSLAAVPSSQQMLVAAGGLPPFDSNYGWTTTDGIASGATTITNSGQNIHCVYSGGTNCTTKRATTAISGKTYAEFSMSTAQWASYGIGVTEVPWSGSNWYASIANSAGIWHHAGGCGISGTNGYYNGSTRTSNAAYATVVDTNIGIAFDPATRDIWFRINGSWVSGDPAAGTSPTATIAGGSTFYFVVQMYSCFPSNGTYDWKIYPSAALQTYAAPSGFSSYKP